MFAELNQSSGSHDNDSSNSSIDRKEPGSADLREQSHPWLKRLDPVGSLYRKAAPSAAMVENASPFSVFLKPQAVARMLVMRNKTDAKPAEPAAAETKCAANLAKGSEEKISPPDREEGTFVPLMEPSEAATEEKLRRLRFLVEEKTKAIQNAAVTTETPVRPRKTVPASGQHSATPNRRASELQPRAGRVQATAAASIVYLCGRYGRMQARRSTS
ncbi:MAG: hypothetical protein P4M11_00950 [Candidatus Pacebacteria bacterium]|nr:hypothetical protein [Candidatus Paceibacterota bacterium]